MKYTCRYYDPGRKYLMRSFMLQILKKRRKDRNDSARLEVPVYPKLGVYAL